MIGQSANRIEQRGGVKHLVAHAFAHRLCHAQHPLITFAACDLERQVSARSRGWPKRSTKVRPAQPAGKA